MRPPLLIVSFVLVLTSCATSSKTKYFDMFWKPVKNPASATFYRNVEKQNNNFLVKDYYISGKLQMVAVCSQIEPKLSTVGNATLYYENGYIQQQGAFNNEKPVGYHKYYSDAGKLTKEIIHNGDEKKYVSYYSKEGVNLLVNGNGVITEEHQQSTEHLEISDSILVLSYSTFPQSPDTLYGVVEKRAEYVGGMNKLFQDLNANLVYPAFARRMGTQGMVYIQFTISKFGKVRDLKVIKSLSLDCDASASDAITKLHEWEPAMHKGKPVATSFVLPISFKLTR